MKVEFKPENPDGRGEDNCTIEVLIDPDECFLTLSRSTDNDDTARVCHMHRSDLKRFVRVVGAALRGLA